MLHRQIDQELQGFGHFRIIKIGLVTGIIGQDHIILGRQTLEQPIGEAGAWDPHTPLGDIAIAVGLGQLLTKFNHFFPGSRRRIRVQASVLKGFLVPVQYRGGALERNAIGLAAGHAVRHESRIEGRQPGLVFIGFCQTIEGDDRVFFDQAEHVHRQDHRQLGRGAALCCGQGLGDRVLIAAGINRVDFNIGIGGGIFVGQGLNGVSSLTPNGNGEEELQINRKG